MTIAESPKKEVATERSASLFLYVVELVLALTMFLSSLITGIAALNHHKIPFDIATIDNREAIPVAVTLFFVATAIWLPIIVQAILVICRRIKDSNKVNQS